MIEAKTKTRIHLVTVLGKARLVRAATKNQAIRHVARDLIAARLASQDDLVEQLGAGMKVEDATSEPSDQDEEAVVF